LRIFFEDAKRDQKGNLVPRGADFDHFICPYTKDNFPRNEAKNFYQGLWIAYLRKNPDLVQYLQTHVGENLGNSFRCQRVLAEYTADPHGFIEKSKSTNWYRNLAQKQKQPKAQNIKQKRPSLTDQIDGAKRSTIHSEEKQNINREKPR